MEDFARLHLYFGGLQQAIANGTIQVGLEWRNTSGGSPSIKIYWAAEADGGDEYLKNTDGQETWATSQATEDQFCIKLGTITNGGAFKFPQDFWQTSLNGTPVLSADHPNRYLLFEGVTEGKGQLVFTFWKGNQKIGEGGSCWLDLKNVKKMYQSSQGDQFAGKPWDETDDTIIFVHGWNMSPEGRTSFAETMFKRLWQRGFKGRFAAFQWDTDYSSNWQWLPYGGGVIDAYLATYNHSEQIAWQSAAALKAFVGGLPGSKKHLAAHSMGNIVASEALKQGMAVNNYALLQAALPAACYDESPAIQQTQQYNHLTFTMWDNLTPDDDLDSATRALAYRGRFKDAGGNLVSFFLPEDYATSFAWEINNDQAKPPYGPLAANYQYQRNYPDGQKLFKFTSYDPYQQIYNGRTSLSDPYESMSFACRTWGKAAGAWGATDGSINLPAAVNLGTSAFQLPDETKTGFGENHSGEFNARIQKLKLFYDTLLGKFLIDTNP